MSEEGYYLIDRVINKQLYEEMLLRQVEAYAGIQMSKKVGIVHLIKNKLPISQVISVLDPVGIALKHFSLYTRHVPTVNQIEMLLDAGMTRLITNSQFFAKISPKAGGFDSELWIHSYSQVREKLKQAHATLHVNRVDRSECFLVELDGGFSGSHRMLLMGVKQILSKELLHYDLQFPKKYTTHPRFFMDHARKEKTDIISVSDTQYIVGYVKAKDRVFLLVNTTRAKNKWCIYDALPE